MRLVGIKLCEIYHDMEFPLYLANSKDWHTLSMERKHVVRTEIVVSVQCEFRVHSTRKQVTGD